VVGASTALQDDFRPFFHPFLWEDGVIRDLGVLGRSECPDPTEHCDAADGEALDINDAGAVVGRSSDSTRRMRPFLWENGRMQDLGVFPGPWTEAVLINDRGDIAGHYWSSDFTTKGAFYWHGGAALDLGSLGSHTTVVAMNNGGEIVGSSGNPALGGGSHAFVWRGGRLYDLGVGPRGGDFSEAVAINERGDVIGWSGTGGSWEPNRRAILWRRVASGPVSAAH
jgi:probable HAF family extracellular repeat protein